MTEHLRFLLTGIEATLTPMLELYVDLHQHPELSGMEERTAAAVGAALVHAGLVVTPRVGGHGLVGLLHNGIGPTVMLRAELDALPVEERTGLHYASEDSHVMHACGHDLHLAALCGAVEVLAGARDQWCGTVIAVAQPAAETLTGAADMLADGLYRRAHLAALGESRILGIAPSLAADDFALYGVAGVPTAYWTVGCVSPRDWAIQRGSGLPGNHSPDFAPDPVPTLRTATAALVAAAWSALAAPRHDP